MTKKTAYIAGKMRGVPFFGFPAFDRAAELGRSLGWQVISPAEMDREHGIDEKQFPTGEGNFTPADVREFARRDTDILLHFLRAEHGDAIALLPGWETSTGAKAELAIAKWVGLKVLDATTFKELET